MPPTLDARTGLVVLLVGSCKDLERRNVYQVVEAADAMRFPPPSFKFTQRV